MLCTGTGHGVIDPLNQMGQKAAHLLINRLLRRKARSVPSVTIAGNLVIRASCGAVSV